MADNIVKVQQGTLAGVISDDGLVRSYKGVPFAEPPIGDLRWRPPRPARSWEGVRPAKSYAPFAPQPTLAFHETHESSEDCLYLNVWTAAGDVDERRPVMVWVHPGAFMMGGGGSPDFDGEQLARAGAVVVTFNYRLSALGFAAHPELSEESEFGTSGNYGLMDQVEALRWVQQNIAAFGGDPDCVTIFGLSAGSASVSLLMATPLARGLFHRAIGESGGLLAPQMGRSRYGDVLAELHSAEQDGLTLERALGCKSIEEMRRRPAQDVVGVSPKDLLPQFSPEPAGWIWADAPLVWGSLECTYPIVDGYVLPRTPFEIFSSGEQADVPLLTGTARDEGMAHPYIPDLAEWERQSRIEYGVYADRFLRAYPATHDNVRDLSGVAFADRAFIWQNWTWVRLHSRTLGAPSFYYHWSRVPPVPAEFQNDSNRGAHHGAEVLYVFGNLDIRPWPWTKVDRALEHTVLNFWLNFARTGDPNAEDLPRWSPFDPDEPRVMHFGDETSMDSVPRQAQLEFWDDFYGVSPILREGRVAARVG